MLKKKSLQAHTLSELCQYPSMTNVLPIPLSVPFSSSVQVITEDGDNRVEDSSEPVVNITILPYSSYPEG